MSKLKYQAKLVFYTLYIYSPWFKNAHHHTLPYFSQCASPELANDIFTSPNKHDPNWKSSGATSEAEYFLWRYSGCGMVSFQMILKYLTGKKVPFVELGKQAIPYGGYKYDENAFKKKDYHQALEGMYYKGFLDFIKAEYDLHGRMSTDLSIPEIIYELSKNNFIMASVNSTIRWYPEKVKPRGGHLIAITGYDLKKQMIYFNDPAGIYKKSQENVQMPFSGFKLYFQNRGIVINNPK